MKTLMKNEVYIMCICSSLKLNFKLHLIPPVSLSLPVKTGVGNPLGTFPSCNVGHDEEYIRPKVSSTLNIAHS